MLILPLGLGVSACGPRVRSTSVGTASSAASVDAASVRVAATYVPDGATQVGIVETHSTAAAGMPDLIQSFRAEVGRVGGDFGKVDSIRTRFEWQQQTRTESYSCGTPQAPQTCSRVVTQNVEVGIVTLMGRAFRTAGTS